MNETTLISLMRQGTGIDMLLRLRAGELRRVEEEKEIGFLNLPNRKGLYEEFRRRVLHLHRLPYHVRPGPKCELLKRLVTGRVEAAMA